MNRLHSPTRLIGYTLIEMLLVIAIITLLTSIGIMFYRNHQINSRIEKAALEMQNVISAAINFNNDNQHWPLANNTDTCSTELPTSEDAQNFISHYLPNQNLGTLFGNYYCWGTFNDDTHLFWLAMKVPHNASVAKRIASLLPSTIATRDLSSPQQVECSSDPDEPSAECFVRIEVITAGKPMGLQQKVVADIGNCDSEHPSDPTRNSPHCKFVQVNPTDNTTDYNVSFNCPQGMLGSLIASANFMDIGRTKNHQYPFSLRTMNINAQHPCPMSPEGTINCTLHIDSLRANKSSIARGNGGHVGASYLAYCYNNSTTHKTALIENNL